MTKRVEIALLLAIIVVGFVLRWTGLEWGEGYQPSAIGDEIEAYRVGLGLVHGERQAFYLGEPEDSGVHVAGPLFALCWAGLLLAGGGPDAMTATIIVLSMFGIILVYLLAKRLFNGPVALWASLFCATSPWPVYNSVGCWSPPFMAVLGAALYLALWDVMTRPRSAQVFWVMLIPAAMLQFHMFGMFLLPGILVLLGLRFPEVNRRWLIAGLVAAVLLYVPYVVGETLNDWENTRKFLSVHNSFSVASFKSLSLPVAAMSSYFASAVGGRFAEYGQFGDDMFGSFGVVLTFNALSIVLAVVFVAHFVRRLIAALRGNWWAPRRAWAAAPATVFAGVLLLTPLLLFALIGRNYASRYVIVEYPLLFLLPALFLTAPIGPRWRKLIGAAVTLTVGFNLLLTPAFFRYQRNLIDHGDYFVASFRRMEQVHQQLVADAGPACRVRVDPAAFAGPRFASTNCGPWLLATYVDVVEHYDPQRQAAQQVQVYRAERLANLAEGRAAVVYAGHGIALVKAPHQR
ncbi:MAG: hypothetical protein ABSD58_00735 [Verrucomicrobiia bacterium]|jgi:hypothetical protein